MTSPLLALIALRLPGVDVVGLAQVHRRHLVETMQRYTRLKDDAGGSGAGDDDLALVLVVDAEIYRLDALIRWLDTAVSRVRRRVADADVVPASSPTGQRTPRPVEAR